MPIMSFERGPHYKAFVRKCVCAQRSNPRKSCLCKPITNVTPMLRVLYTVYYVCFVLAFAFASLSALGFSAKQGHFWRQRWRPI